MANFQKLDNSGLKGRFVREIQEKIFSGELKAGEQLPPERALAAQMGVSRSLVNVGIMELESMGFLEIVPRRGTFVRDYKQNPTPQTLTALMAYGDIRMDYPLFRSLMETRLLIERECTRMSVLRLEPVAEYRQMRACIEEMRAAEQLEPLVDALYNFHDLLVRSSGNVVYPMLFHGFELALRHLMEVHLRQRVPYDDYIALYEDFMDCLAARDADAADKAITGILNAGVTILEKPYWM